MQTFFPLTKQVQTFKKEVIAQNRYQGIHDLFPVYGPSLMTWSSLKLYKRVPIKIKVTLTTTKGYLTQSRRRTRQNIAYHAISCSISFSDWAKFKSTYVCSYHLIFTLVSRLSDIINGPKRKLWIIPLWGETKELYVYEMVIA